MQMQKKKEMNTTGHGIIPYLKGDKKTGRYWKGKLSRSMVLEIRSKNIQLDIQYVNISNRYQIHAEG